MGPTDIVEMLIRGGADMNASDREGRTPLDAARAARSKKSMIALARAGAKIPDRIDNKEDMATLRPFAVARGIAFARAATSIDGPASLLAGFPKILRYIVTKSMPTWISKRHHLKPK